MAIVDGFHYWLLKQPVEPTGVKATSVSTEVA